MKTKITLTALFAMLLVMLDGQNNTPETNPRKILNPLDRTSTIAAATPGEIAQPLHSSDQNMDFLLKQADDLNDIAQNLRRQAKTKDQNERSSLLTEAIQYEKKAIYTQLDALEMAGDLNLSKYRQNKIRIEKLIKTYNGEEYIAHQIRFLIQSSEKNMRLATEMREEAHSLSNLATRLGNMSNAEEKELIALNEQTEVITQLGNTQKNRMH